MLKAKEKIYCTLFVFLFWGGAINLFKETTVNFCEIVDHQSLWQNDYKALDPYLSMKEGDANQLVKW